MKTGNSWYSNSRCSPKSSSCLSPSTVFEASSSSSASRKLSSCTGKFSSTGTPPLLSFSLCPPLLLTPGVLTGWIEGSKPFAGQQTSGRFFEKPQCLLLQSLLKLKTKNLPVYHLSWFFSPELIFPTRVNFSHLSCSNLADLLRPAMSGQREALVHTSSSPHLGWFSFFLTHHRHHTWVDFHLFPSSIISAHPASLAPGRTTLLPPKEVEARKRTKTSRCIFTTGRNHSGTDWLIDLHKLKQSRCDFPLTKWMIQMESDPANGQERTNLNPTAMRGWGTSETGNPSWEGCFSLKCPALLKCSPPVFSRSLSPSVRRWISISLAEERNPLLVSLLALVQLVHRQQKLLLTVSTGGNSYKPGVNLLAPVQMSRSISPDILLEGSPIWPFLLQSNQPCSGRLVHLKIPYFHL